MSRSGVSAEAVEAAARGLADLAGHPREWHFYISEATTALEAAAPHLMAESFQDFAEFIEKPKHDGLDGYTLRQVALEAQARADSYRNAGAVAPHCIAGHFREINRKAIANEIKNPLQFKKDAL